MTCGCSASGQQGHETAPPLAREPVANEPPRDAGSAPTQSPEAGAAPCAPLQVAVPALISHELDVPLPALQDPQNNLAPFHRAAIEFLRGNRTHLRIGFYGDSNMTREFVSGPLRRTLQLAHGDGGHGYIAAGKAWRWYDHWDVTLHHQGGWDFFTPSTKAAKRPLYGHAGIRFDTRDRKALSRVTTAEAGAVGQDGESFWSVLPHAQGGRQLRARGGRNGRAGRRNLRGRQQSCLRRGQHAGRSSQLRAARPGEAPLGFDSRPRHRTRPGNRHRFAGHWRSCVARPGQHG